MIGLPYFNKSHPYLFNILTFRVEREGNRDEKNRYAVIIPRDWSLWNCKKPSHVPVQKAGF